MVKKIKENLSEISIGNSQMYTLGLSAFSVDNLIKWIVVSYKYRKIKDNIVLSMEEIINGECYKLTEDIFYQIKSMENLSELSNKYALIGLTTGVLLIWSLFYGTKRNIKYTDKGAILENMFDK